VPAEIEQRVVGSCHCPQLGGPDYQPAADTMITGALAEPLEHKRIYIVYGRVERGHCRPFERRRLQARHLARVL